MIEYRVTSGFQS